MKITPKILHLPPYLSTTWAQISTLSFQDGTLLILLADGSKISIPGLSQEVIETIFAARSAFLEATASSPASSPATKPQPETSNHIQLFHMSAPLSEEALSQFGPGALESMGSPLLHNPAQANMPPLPPEVLQKIAEIARIVAPDDLDSLPKAEPHCNCVHCQIARAVHEELGGRQHPELLDVQEEVKDEELSFRQWEIVQVDDQLYSVTSRLDPQERYTVYLGDPVGCTCGQQGCEHILAVLKS